MTLGQRIRELRTNSELSQEDLGKILKVSRNTMGKYERDLYEPDVKMLIDIANYFNVSLDYLLGRTDNKTTLTQTFDIPVSSDKLHHIITSIRDNLYNIISLKNSDFFGFLKYKNNIDSSLEQIFKIKNKG